ncbi:DUF6210 family protein [Sorangium cellulosum]|uniref:Uncharacterized protein n=1 Tax=Sorangium cellulosum TaxID=56 RepID=A0A150QDT8_SORCE|nr:DUF6210 family protein [Sorangium cellulosum]KYF66073.1 hypothetical protein BE15_41590 [Sorangium cellulosum]
MRMPVVDLGSAVGFGAIVSFPSGVLYSNQTGGTSCLHPEIEGIYVPLANDCLLPGNTLVGPEIELYAYFDGPKHLGAGATRGLDEEDAGFINGVLARYMLSGFLAVDQSRLKDSHEAWVWSVLTGEPELSHGFSGFGPYPRAAVLTWSNTD